MTRTLIRTNLLIDPSGEVNVDRWSTGASNCVVTSNSNVAFFGKKSVQVAITATNVATAMGTSASTYMVPITAGVPYIFSVYALGIGPEISRQLTTNLYFRDATNVVVAGGSFNGNPTVTVGNSKWERVVTALTIVAPAGAVNLQININVVPITAVAGDIFVVDGFLLEATNILSPAFDGSTPATADLFNKWTGAANASTSEQYRINLDERANPQQAIADAKKQALERILGASPVRTVSGSIADVKKAGLEKVLTDNGQL